MDHVARFESVIRAAGRTRCVLAMFLAIVATSCAEVTTTGVPFAPTVRLTVDAEVGPLGRIVEIRVSYRRRASDGVNTELVGLPATPDEVTVDPGPVRIPFTADLTACLADDARLGPEVRPGACSIVVELRLLRQDGNLLDSETVTPQLGAAGEDVTLPPVTLSAPVIVLGQTTMRFDAITGGSLPAVQASTISNGGGGTLDVVLSISYSGAAGWLGASTSTAGQVSVQPTTTSLAPGSYAASVTVASAVASNGSQSIAVTYVVSPVPQRTLAISGAGTGAGRVTSTPAGIDCTITAGVPTGACNASFALGVSVALNATANGGSTFGGWNGDCSGAGGCTVILDQARGVTASFVLNRPTLTVSNGGGSGTGRVTSVPAGIDCTMTGSGTSGTCAASYDEGTAVTLTASASGGNAFAGWGGACSGTGVCQVTMTQPRAVTAAFSAPFTLSVAGLGNGGGNVSSVPAGITCTVAAGTSSGTCSAVYAPGTPVTLSAAPNATSVFTGWSGACSGTGACQVTMSDVRSVTASFALVTHQLTVTASGTGSGTVAGTPAGISCTIDGASAGGDCAEAYPVGTVVTLAATPAANMRFTGWGGACSGAFACQVTMTGARSVVASFAPIVHTLTVIGAGAGSGRVTSDVGGIDCAIAAGSATGTCSAAYTQGTVVTLTATPNGTDSFAGWSGVCSGTGSCVVTMSQARSMIATFAPPVVTFALTVDPATGNAGTGTVSGGGISCTITGTSKTGTCAQTPVSGTVVTLTASPAASNVFAGWGGPCTGTGQCTVTMSQAQTVTASFLVTRPVTVDAASGNPGSGTITGGGLTCSIVGSSKSGTCTASHPSGTAVTLTATPIPGYDFAGWGGDCSGTGTCQLTLTQARNVTAAFSALSGSLTLYVSPSGSDANPGTVGSPLRTIQRGADLARPGDVVMVEDGVWTDTDGDGSVVAINRGGTATAFVTFRSRNRWGAKLDGRNGEAAQGFDLNNGIGYVRIEGFEIFGIANVGTPRGSASGIDLYDGGHDSQMVGNHIHHIGRVCTNSGNTNGQVGIFVQQPNVTVEGNLIHDIGRFFPGENGCSYTSDFHGYETLDHGMYLNGGSPGADGTMIRNNIFYNTRHGWAVQMYPGSLSNVHVLNNTFAYGNANKNHTHIVLDASISASSIVNNIFYNPEGGRTIEAAGFSGSITISHNLTMGTAMTDRSTTPSGMTMVNNRVGTNPLFVDAAGFDFRLQAGSPAIDTGLALAMVTLDFTGRLRPAGAAFDLGAYEF